MDWLLGAASRPPYNFLYTGSPKLRRIIEQTHDYWCIKRYGVTFDHPHTWHMARAAPPCRCRYVLAPPGRDSGIDKALL